MYKIKQFFFRIKRLLRWIPVIWRTRTWDYQYTLNILRHSLLELAECVENGITVSGPEHAKQIRYVCELIERLDNNTAWDMTWDAGKALDLEEMYWNEIWTTIQKHGRGWWD